MNTFDPNTNLNFQSGGLPAEDVALDQLMAHLGKAEQSLATNAMLDRIAVASWNAPAVQREPDVLPFAAHIVGQGGTTAVKGTRDHRRWHHRISERFEPRVARSARRPRRPSDQARRPQRRRPRSHRRAVGRVLFRRTLGRRV